MDFTAMSKFPIIILAYFFMSKSSLANEHKKELKDVICAPYKYGPTIFVPHPYDCSHYFMCSNSEAVEFICPNGLLFDTNLNVCNYPNQVTCVNSTTTLTTTTNLPTSSLSTTTLPTSSTTATLPTSTTTTSPTSSTTTTLGSPVTGSPLEGEQQGGACSSWFCWFYNISFNFHTAS